MTTKRKTTCLLLLLIGTLGSWLVSCGNDVGPPLTIRYIYVNDSGYRLSIMSYRNVYEPPAFERRFVIPKDDSLVQELLIRLPGGDASHLMSTSDSLAVLFGHNKVLTFSNRVSTPSSGSRRSISDLDGTGYNKGPRFTIVRYVFTAADYDSAIDCGGKCVRCSP